MDSYYKELIEDRIKHFESIQPKQHSNESRVLVSHIIFELKAILLKGEDDKRLCTCDCNRSNYEICR